MRLDKFTLRGQEAIQAAIELAERNQHQQVEPEHLLIAMLEQPEGIVRPVLGKLGANVASLVNDKYLTLHVLKGCNMRIKKLVAPWDTDATGRRVVWEGQLCSWRQYRTHAYLTN